MQVRAQDFDDAGSAYTIVRAPTRAKGRAGAMGAGSEGRLG